MDGKWVSILKMTVHHFKQGGGNTKNWGMTGQESDAATLFRLYVDYGRYTEATNLLLEYIETFSSLVK